MAPDTSSTPEGQRSEKGLATQWMLVLCLGLVVSCCTVVSLLLVHQRIQHQTQHESMEQMQRSLETWRNVEAQQLQTLQQENALLSQLPSLKALMTTKDDRTITDAALDFWKISGNDLFALLDRDGHVRALYVRDQPPSLAFREDLSQTLRDPNLHYLVSDNRLFSYAVRPLYFGSEETGTILGYVISGDAVNNRLLRQVSKPASVEASFLSGSTIVADTREHPEGDAELARVTGSLQRVQLSGEPYLAEAQDLSAIANRPLKLILLKSLLPLEAQLTSLRRLLIGLGFATVVGGSLVMIFVSRWITRPLEVLAHSVRAFGHRDQDAPLPATGTLEVKQLSADFATMRQRIEETSRVLMEKERLATVGSMASSFSHDLRHYLTAVYANAEFLATVELPSSERAELLNEIRGAVTGTTDLIDSLLVFSRTGKHPVCVAERMPIILQRALDLVRKHPDAHGVTFAVEDQTTDDGLVSVDVKQVERALFNLLLNAAQSAYRWSESPMVTVAVAGMEESVTVTVVDNGGGVPERIREHLFQPFVSDGKVNGTGLGLTLAHRVAEDYGGGVELVRSAPGRTEFAFNIKRSLPDLSGAATSMDSAPAGERP